MQNQAIWERCAARRKYFARSLLVLPDLKLLQAQAFRNLAASAQLWQAMASCAPDSLPAWMAARRVAGYGMVALQWSAEATPISEFTYPVNH